MSVCVHAFLLRTQYGFSCTVESNWWFELYGLQYNHILYSI